MEGPEAALDHHEELYWLQNNVGLGEQCLNPKGFTGASQCFFTQIDTNNVYSNHGTPTTARQSQIQTLQG